jgi:hypothetical protein
MRNSVAYYDEPCNLEYASVQLVFLPLLSFLRRIYLEILARARSYWRVE